MSVCHLNCAKAIQRKLDYEKKQAVKKLYKEEHNNKKIKKKLNYSSSYSSSINEDKNSQIKNTSEYQSSNDSIVLSHVNLPDETSVTPIPSFTNKRHPNLLNEKTPKCTPRNGKCRDQSKSTNTYKKTPKNNNYKLSSRDQSPDNPRNDKTFNKLQTDISLFISNDQSQHSYNTDTTTDTKKYFDNYILENDSCDNEQENFDNSTSYKSPVIKINKKLSKLNKKKNKNNDDDDDELIQNDLSQYPSCPSFYDDDDDNNNNNSRSIERKKKLENKKNPRDYLFEQLKQKKEVEFDNDIRDWRCFDDLCFCSLKCTTNIFKDKFIKKIVTSAAFCCIGIRLCRELDSWYIPF